MKKFHRTEIILVLLCKTFPMGTPIGGSVATVLHRTPSREQGLACGGVQSMCSFAWSYEVEAMGRTQCNWRPRTAVLQCHEAQPQMWWFLNPNVCPPPREVVSIVLQIEGGR